MEQKFKQIVSEQREELPVILRQGWVPREQEQFIDTDSRQAQIITGVRRAGKSTIAHRALKGIPYAYVNFDDERLANPGADALDKLLEALYAIYGEFHHLLLDEIQHVNHWHLFVNRLLRNGIRVFLTGSNSRLLRDEMATHLTGRYKAMEVFPFSFREFLTLKNFEWTGSGTAKELGIVKGFFNEYMTHGGFPEIALGEAGTGYAEHLFDDIITRDIIFRYHIRHIRSFRETARYLSGNYGSEISFNRIKNLFGIGSENTAKNYISHLGEAYLIPTLPKFSFKNQERLRYRKTYIIDTSFAHITGLDFTPNTGKLLENVVYLELARRTSGSQFELFYYKQVYEVDFLLYRNRKVHELIQVTQSIRDAKTMNREIRALIHAAIALKAGKLTIITLDDSRIIESQGFNIHVLPITEWLMGK